MTEKGENLQPDLFKLPKVPKDISDFLKPDGKKKGSIPTGMSREEINDLKKNKAKGGPAAIGADDWAKK